MKIYIFVHTQILKFLFHLLHFCFLICFSEPGETKCPSPPLKTYYVQFWTVLLISYLSVKLMLLIILVSISDLPNRLVCLHQHRPISPGQRHRVVADVHLTATQQNLTTDLQPLIQDRQEEDADTRADHL